MKNRIVKALAVSAALCMAVAGTCFAEEAAAEEAAAEVVEAAEEVVSEAEEAVEEAAAEAEEAVEEAVEAAEDALEEEADTGTAPEEPGVVYEPNVGETPKDQAILVVSFGTSFNANRAETICAIEDAVAEAFPEYDVRRAFTAQIIIDKLAARDNVIIDNVQEALDRAIDDGVKTLVVQPTLLMNGLEYNDLEATLAEYADAMDITLSAPLLTSDEDFSKVAEVITTETKDYDDGDTAVCFMGHGTEAESNKVYAQMQDVLTEAGFEHYYVGTVEATPSLDDVLAAVGEGEYAKVVLEPLMVVAGDHANNDMAGDEDDSWKTVFQNAGYEVEPVLKGLGSFEGIQEIYIEHLKSVMEAE